MEFSKNFVHLIYFRYYLTRISQEIVQEWLVSIFCYLLRLLKGFFFLLLFILCNHLTDRKKKKQAMSLSEFHAAVATTEPEQPPASSRINWADEMEALDEDDRT